MTISIKQVKVSELKPAAYNPRKWSEKATRELKDSIESFGLVDPIICNQAPGRENVVIGGHFRLHVAKQLGYAEVPVVYISVPDVDKEKELNIRLNKNSGDFDLDLLKNFDADLLARIGFDSAELDKIFQEPPTDADDAVPDVPEKPKSKLGDIYLLGRHRVMCGDSTSREDVARLMDGKQADMVFTDPPYGVDYSGGIQFTKQGVKKEQRNRLQNDDVDIYKSVIPIMASICEGPIYTWFAGTKARTLYEAVEAVGDIHALLIWKKNGGYAALNAHYKQKHEPCLYWKAKGKNLKWSGESTETTIWDIDKDGVNKLHPTQKPVELACKAIRNHSVGLVVDIFLGSGSTLIACEKTNRRCYGMELDPKYVDVIVKRWEDYTGKKAEKI